MRPKYVLLALAFIPAALCAQPGKKKAAEIPKKEVAPPNDMIINDTLQLRFDTTQVQYRVWQEGVGPQSYLSRVNGYLLKITKVGKHTSGGQTFEYYDGNWKAIRPEDLEVELTKTFNWARKPK